jgi:WD repeat and SOF domain-containing protein 1
LRACLGTLADSSRWLPFDPSRNWPDLGSRFSKGEKALREAQRAAAAEAERTVGAGAAAGALHTTSPAEASDNVEGVEDMDDEVDLSWSTVLKRTFEAYLRQERPNMYGEWLTWESAAPAGAGAST